MTLRVIIDNGAPLPDRLRELIGIDRFGKLIFKRRTIAEIIRAAVAAAGLEPPIFIDGPADLETLAEQVRRENRPEDRFLLCPAGVVAGHGPDALTMFLRQARFAPQNLIMPAQGASSEWSGWQLMLAPVFRDYLAAREMDDLDGFFDRIRAEFVLVDERLGLVDLGDEVTLLEFLSGTFDARFFNAIERDAYTITKASTDKAKLEREYKLYEMLPAQMQMFFIRPFAFTDRGETASYKMERLFVPDMAVQWLHGALTETEFRRFLDHVMYFVSIRERRPADPGEAERAIEDLFVTKVRERLEKMKALSEHAALAPLFDRACGGLDALFDRYLALFNRMRRDLPTDAMVVGHGDLCFSNILYAKTSQTLKLIDPRGAAKEADLWTHPYYDLAKLSHSVLGQYDFVNQDMFDVSIDENLHPRLSVDRPPTHWATALFLDRLDKAGFPPALVRICEASLFISMLPLHVDRPRKVLGFVLIAIDILEHLERQI